MSSKYAALPGAKMIIGKRRNGRAMIFPADFVGQDGKKKSNLLPSGRKRMAELRMQDAQNTLNNPQYRMSKNGVYGSRPFATSSRNPIRF